MKQTPGLNDFTFGEIDQSFFGLSEHPVYFKAAATIQNFIPRLQGGFYKRPGTLVCGHTNADLSARIIPFVIDSTHVYVLEFTNNLVRVWKNGVWQGAGSNIVTTYATADIPNLQFYTNYPDLFITGKNYAPARIRWTSPDTLTLVTLTFITNSLTQYNATTGAPVQPPATGTNITGTWTSGSNQITGVPTNQLPAENTWFITDMTNGNIPAGTYVTSIAATAGTNPVTYTLTLSANTTGAGAGSALMFTLQTLPFKDGMDRGDCESTTPPMVSGQTVPYRINCTFVQSGAEFHSGSYSYLITKGASGAGNFAEAYFVQSVGSSILNGFVPGQTYTLSGWFYVPSGGMLLSDCFFQASWWAGGVQSWHPSANPAAYDSWQFVTYTFTVPSNATGVYIEIAAGYNAASGTTLYVDDISLNIGNFPLAVGVFQQRLWFANTGNNPQGIWQSIIEIWDASDPGPPPGALGYVGMAWSDLSTYSVSVAQLNADGTPTTNPITYLPTATFQDQVNDADAGSYTVNSERNDAIQWIRNCQDIILGSASSEWVVPANSTPNNFSAYGVSQTGCSNIPATLVTGGLIFIQRLNRRVYRFQWQGLSNPWVPPEDLTDFSTHLFVNNPITAFDVQVVPDTALWFLRTDGTVAVLLYKQGRCMAWWNFITSGTVNSLCVVPGTDLQGNADRDIVYLCVTRGTSTYIEQVATPYWIDNRTAVFSDCTTYRFNAVKFNTLVVDASFNGKTLEIVCDGAYVGTGVPVGGVLALPVSCNYCAAGYNFTSWLASMPLVAAATDGSASMKTKTLPQHRIRVYNTLYVKVGMTATISQATSVNMKVSYASANPTPVSGAFKAPVLSGMLRDAQVNVYSDLPLPCTVIGLVPDTVTTE